VGGVRRELRVMERYRQHTTQGDILQDNCLDFSNKVIIQNKTKGKENCSGLKGTKEAIAKCTMNTAWILEQNLSCKR